MIGKLLLHIGNNLSKTRCVLTNKCGLFQKTAGVLGWRKECNPRKALHFYPHLSLQTAFPTLNLPQNWYIMATGSLFQHIYSVRKTIVTICQNMKARGKIPISQLFSELGKMWMYFKIPIFNLFHELRKNNNSS